MLCVRNEGDLRYSEWNFISSYLQFTPFCTDLWRLFHPLMSEPNIAVHPNKQVIYTFVVTDNNDFIICGKLKAKLCNVVKITLHFS